jgi:bleomycin hydrolase
MNKIRNCIVIGILLISITAFAKDKGKNIFSDKVKLGFTSVKSQGSTGTCWSFATTSFLESELLRTGKGEFNLSEMYFVTKAYKNKAISYYLYHGNNNFSEGGQAHDVFNVIKEFGIVPDSIFPGKKIDGRFQHRDLVQELNIELKKSKKWSKTFNASITKNLNPIFKKYLGNTPKEFEFKGDLFTPTSFRDFLEIKPDNYIEISSYLHHPFYKPFILEIPDNWSHDAYYNLPIDELIEVLEYALENGFTVCWDGDTSERTFTHKKAKADLPKNQIGKIDQELRQKTFYNRKTTDDHLMHLVGLATNKDGRIFFNTKNSWGSNSNKNGGLLYLSEDYVRLKTISILLHRDAIPKKIANKLNLQ